MRVTTRRLLEQQMVVVVASDSGMKDECHVACATKTPQSLNICVFNVHGCTTNEVKKGQGQ